MSNIFWSWYSYNVTARLINNYINVLICSRRRVQWMFSIIKILLVKVDSSEIGKITAFLVQIFVFLHLAINTVVTENWKLIAIFVELEHNTIEQSFIVLHSDQHYNVHGLRQMQNETKSVVSISETVEKKSYH